MLNYQTIHYNQFETLDNVTITYLEKQRWHGVQHKFHSLFRCSYFNRLRLLHITFVKISHPNRILFKKVICENDSNNKIAQIVFSYSA